MIDIRRILCAIDFSDTSRHALDHAVALARFYDARLTVMHATSAPYFQPPILFADFAGPIPNAADRVWLSERLRLWTVAAGASDRHVETLLQEGPPARRILDFARADHSDLIVLGTHGRNALQHLLLGSVAEKVVHTAHCPVLTVPPKAPRSMLPYQRIVCAVDFSTPSLAAFTTAVSIAQEAGARLTIVHALDWPAADPELQAYDTPEYRASLEAGARARIEELLPVHLRTWCETEVRVVFGKADHKIVDLAARDRADLIVMGAHGRNALGLMLFGSTTNHVVRQAACPVLTLRP